MNDAWRQPSKEALERPAVDDAVGRYAGQARVRIAVEREQAAGVERGRGQLEVHVLPRRIAVDFDGHFAAGGVGEHPRCLVLGATQP